MYYTILENRGHHGPDAMANGKSLNNFHLIL
jgi:hypothetical protein